MAGIPAANSARPCPNLLLRAVVPCFARGRANQAPNCRRTRASVVSRAPKVANRITREAGSRECPSHRVQNWMMVLQALNSRNAPTLGNCPSLRMRRPEPGPDIAAYGKRTVSDKGRGPKRPMDRLPVRRCSARPQLSRRRCCQLPTNGSAKPTMLARPGGETAPAVAVCAGQQPATAVQRAIGHRACLGPDGSDECAFVTFCRAVDGLAVCPEPSLLSDEGR
jgi:hypothetical protein